MLLRGGPGPRPSVRPSYSPPPLLNASSRLQPQTQDPVSSGARVAAPTCGARLCPLELRVPCGCWATLCPQVPCPAAARRTGRLLCPATLHVLDLCGAGCRSLAPGHAERPVLDPKGRRGMDQTGHPPFPEREGGLPGRAVAEGRPRAWGAGWGLSLNEACSGAREGLKSRAAVCTPQTWPAHLQARGVAGWR